ncbi:TPA: hypothetical protein ACSP2I_000585 [Aeromonas veronii]
MLFTDIKLVGFFSNIPLELAFGKKIRRITAQALSSGCHPGTSRTHSRTIGMSWCSPPRKMKNAFAKNENPPQRWFYQTW